MLSSEDLWFGQGRLRMMGSVRIKYLHDIDIMVAKEIKIQGNC